MADFMVAGVRYREFGFPSKVAAEAWELEARAALKMGRPLPPTGRGKTAGGRDAGTLGLALRSAVTLHWGRLRGSHKTVYNAEAFVNWAGAKLPVTEAFTEAKVREFVTYLIEERKVGNATLNRYMSALSVLIRHSGLPKNARPALPWFKGHVARVRFFTPEEEQAVIRLLSQWGRHRELDFFMFLLDTGLRPWAEGCRLTWANIKNGVIDVRGKVAKAGSEWRTVPLTKRAQLVLGRAPRELDGPFADLKQFTMNGLWDRVRAQLPALDDTVWYTCRHTFASRLVQAGESLKAVAVLMGNSAEIVDRVYAHLAPDHLKDAVASLEKFGSPRFSVIEGGPGDKSGDKSGDK